MRAVQALSKTWRIPGFVPGILFLFLVVRLAVGNMDLAVELFEEQDWNNCRRECRRVFDDDPQAEKAALLGSISLLRQGNDIAAAQATLERLAAGAADREARAMAAYELGRLQWARGEAEAAARNLQKAFLLTSDHALFLRAGCSLDLLRKDSPIIGTLDPAVFQSLETSRALWSRDLVRECGMRKEKAGSILSKPGQWVVAFYRRGIRPAIGARCSLLPSCSEYFNQASRKHGLLAFPLIADRLVREPSVVVMQEHPVHVHDKIRFADPVEDHTWWWSKKE